MAIDKDRLLVRAATRAEVEWMIRAHYLGKWPGVVTMIVGLFRDGESRGVIVFAMPPAQTIKRYGGLTWELARLWVDDREPRNTESWFIARAIRIIRRERKDVRTLVSYADPSAGHSGCVYRAANWTADGRTDDERKSPRCDYVDASGRKYSRRSHVPEGVEISRVPRVSKPRYIWRFA